MPKKTTRDPGAEAAEKAAAEKAAAEKAEAEKAEAAIDHGLIALTKDGETIHAHPRQVAPWVGQGWSVVEDAE